MPDYSKGKIYTIRSHQCDEYYIGSTIQKLSDRLAGHKRGFENWKKGIVRFTTSYNLLKYDDCYIELLESYPCNNKDELKKREGEKQREFRNECINKNIAGRTKKQYREENKNNIEYKNRLKKERIKSYNKHKEQRLKDVKQYREKNKEKIKKYKSQIINCSCGSSIQRDKIRRHERSKKHIEYIKNLTEPSKE